MNPTIAVHSRFMHVPGRVPDGRSPNLRPESAEVAYARVKTESGTERFFRSGGNSEFERLFRRPAAKRAHTCHICHAQDCDKYDEYDKYVPSMWRAW